MNRSKTWLLGVFATLWLMVSGIAYAAPVAAADVPDPLKPWIPWVLGTKDDAMCLALPSEPDARRCAWPARLELQVDEKGGTFSQAWHLDAKRLVPLPGDEKRWPLDVKSAGKRLVVVTQGGLPQVELERGDHVILGRWVWDTAPESLRIPPETGLVSLRLRGSPVREPTRDAEGRVFLQKTGVEAESDQLQIVVHRKLTDDVPLRLTTSIVLRVSGKSREELLATALPSGFVPMALQSPLPARIEADGRLRMQIRPGTWTLELVARSDGPHESLTLPSPNGPWVGEETWAFEARPALRTVMVEGVLAIDPQQTTMPDAWKKLPAYPMRSGSELRLVEKHRGDSAPPPDQLTLARELWLDFDGAHFTSSDTVTGSLSRPRRLEARPPMILGRVSIAEQNQFITRRGESGPAGIELRQGPLRLQADSRIEGDGKSIPVTGWDEDFHAVTGTLHLPPGFRLFHATGVDEVQDTWVRHWTLLEIFLVLVFSLAAWKLYGPSWGMVALFTFALTFPESQAPKWCWAFVLGSEAVYRGLSHTRLRYVTSLLRGGAFVALALLSVAFLVGHVRAAMYPALEKTTEGFDGFMAKSARDIAPQEEAPSAPPPAGGSLPSSDDERAIEDKPAPAKVARGKAGYYQQETVDPSAIVQTGPGLPNWRWRSAALHWSGPVQRGQMLHLYVLPPQVNLLFALARAVLLLFLVLRTLPWHLRGLPLMRPAAAAAWIVVCGWPSLASAEIPSKEMLDELRTRLEAKPACDKECASAGRMLLEALEDRLTIRLEVDAAARTSVPLPSASGQWEPVSVAVDGAAAKALLRSKDGRLWLELEAGAHQIVLDGSLVGRDSVQLSFPLKPHHGEAIARGFRVDGLHEDGLLDENVQIARIAKTSAEAGSALTPGDLPPFVSVERTLHMALNWQVTTKVTRLSPAGSAILLEVPLLRGEAVTSDVRVENGRAIVQLGPQASSLEWTSILEQRSPIDLTAPKTTAWVEVWRLDVSPIWHADTSGIPVAHPEARASTPEWHPWPGEKASIKLERPTGVPGQTLTIDSTEYEVTPGLRTTDAVLTFQVRSSRGAEHTLLLPTGAILESVTINAVSQPLRLDGERLVLPVAPGQLAVRIAFAVPVGVTAWFSPPPVNLGTPSANVTVHMNMGGARWILWTAGPRLGPAVLFWSLLLVIVIVSLLLGRIPLVPLSTWGWALLLIGLSQVHLAAAAVVVGWLLVLGLRKRKSVDEAVLFNLIQIALVGWSFVALGILLVAVHQGLLGHPNMQIEGNGSSASSLLWFSDRVPPAPEMPHVLSVPMFVYRFAMLAWALWLSFAVLRWVKWGFSALGQGGFWRSGPARYRSPEIVTPAPQPPPAPDKDAPPET